MSDRKTIDPDGAIWKAGGQIRGLSELFSMAQAEPPFSEAALKGISHILEDVANDLREIDDEFYLEKRGKKEPEGKGQNEES